MGNQADLDPQTNEAINAALESNWKKAVDLNRNLLEKYSDDIGTMNRLARALTEAGGLNEAKKIYKRILELDPYNQIAEKNLNRLSSLKKGTATNNKPASSVKGDIFLEEPGKTTVLGLDDTAMPQVLADLQIGDKVHLSPHKNVVTVTSSNGRRVGKIGSDFAKPIAQNINAGSKFEAFIKSITIKGGKEKKEKPQVLIFVREIQRSPKVSSPPFPVSSGTFTPFVREEAFIRADQAPVLTEDEDNVVEVEIDEITNNQMGDESLEGLAAKEQEESESLDDE